MTIIFKNKEFNAPIKYEATETEWEFLCMLFSEDIIADNYCFWRLDDIEEVKKDRRLCP